MFITSKEKDWMMASIQTLQQQVKELQETYRNNLKEQIEHNNRIKEILIKIKPRLDGATEAPWGYKKDGTPCKRPGRAPKVKVQP